MKKIMYILLGFVIGLSGAVLAFDYYAKDVSYTPSDLTWQVDNVQKAIDELYVTTSKELYSNFTTSTKREETASIDLDLKAGSYDCYYIFSNAFLSTTEQNVVIDADDFSLSGCDSSESVLQKNYVNTGFSPVKDQNRSGLGQQNYNFKCTVNENKKITVSISLKKSDSSPNSQLIICK